MGLITGLIKRLFKLSIIFLIFAGIIVFIPNLPPYAKFTSINFEPALPRTGPLAHNDALNNVEKAFMGKLLGPEYFQEYKGELYTGLATGEIVKISPGGHVTFVTKLGQPCSGLVQEHICGRPLGFQIDESKGLLYVADAYLGIWRVDLKNDKKQLLVSPRVAINGKEPKLFNSLALGRNGDFYWTDSCDYQLRDGALGSLIDPSGRLLHYSAATNSSNVLLDHIWFANGVVISPDNQFVLVAETFSLRVRKYYIDGPKKGKSEVFIAGLPGYPDNMRALPDGSGVLISLYSAAPPGTPLLARSLASAPLARKLLARISRIIEIPFEYLNTVYPHVVFEEVVHSIGNFKTVSALLPKYSGLVQVDWDGDVVASYYNNDESVGHISDAVVYNNRLYLGAPHNQNFIGSLPIPPTLKKAFEKKETGQAKPVVKKVEEKAKVEVKKPVPTPKPEAQKTKPVEAKQIKPVETKQTKPVEAKPTKPVETKQPKPVEVKQTKPVEVKQTKPVEQPKPNQKPPVKTEPPKAQVKETKPEVKTPGAPKTAPQAEKPKPEVNPKVQPEVKPKVQPEVKPKPKETPKPVKEEPKQEKREIPIKEDIPVDTAKPPKDTLKVIKKAGPTEIPNPGL